MIVLLLTVAAALAAVAGTGLVRRYAIARDLLDHPNARGSHEVATPRGGGLAMVVVILLGAATGVLLELLPLDLALALALGGGLVAGVGFLDDHGEVAARWRLLVHLLATMVAVVLLGPVDTLVLPSGAVPLGLVGVGLSLIAGISLVNLYNFMDGIDGIAGVELVCVAGGMAVLAAGGEVLLLAPLLGVAAGLGFLAWNWPPARIFMGDVGSGFLGFYLGCLLLAGVGSGEICLWAPLILLGVFVVDATITLFTRALTGQPVGEAHRSHAFQLLAARFGHLPVTVGTCAVNLAWLLPLAWLAESRPAWGLPLMLLAWAPLAGLALALGAGRRRA